MVARQSRGAPRGPAATRRVALRADRDGDLAMGLPIKGRAGVSKSSAPPTGPRKETGARSGRGGGIIGANAQRAILRHASGTKEVAMREERTSGARGGLAELKVTGWDKSKASGDADRGVSSLVKWLEKKASTRLGSRQRMVKIKKSYLDGTDLILQVTADDALGLLKVNGFSWAGVNVTVQRLGGPVQPSAGVSSEAEQTKAMFRSVLERRYNFDTKLLNLSELANDEELKNQHIFDSEKTAGKFFPAMMRVLELSFDSPEERNAAVASVSLANNDLSDLTAVTSLHHTFPKLQNLDLSNNRFATLKSLEGWRRRFPKLQHLVLAGNPIAQTEPGYEKELIGWFPALRQFNGVQVRTEEEIARKAKVIDLPFPIRSPYFQDEGGIAEQFVRQFFAGYDTDRAALAAHYYDDRSTFSYAVNAQSPRDPNGAEKPAPGEWEAYMKNSRNLKKLQHLQARENRVYRGPKEVAGVLGLLPPTRHPDMAADAKKYMIEAKLVPRVPDITGASPTGVEGFLITVHGEFAEQVQSTGQIKTRSFDRSFVLGPGGRAGVRIVSDMLLLRSYGGIQAYQPDIEMMTPMGPTFPVLPGGLPAGAEQMVLQLSQQTGMMPEYSKLCLEQVGYNYAGALEAFGRVKGNLPASAFVAQVC